MKIGCSIIICHHTGKLIDKASDSIFLSKGINFEVIVVSSIDTFKNSLCKVIHYNGLPAIKRNLALSHCKYPFIAFFDDDVEVKPNTVLEMLKVCRRPGVGMVFGKLLNFEHRQTFDEAGGFLTPTGFIWARGDREDDRGQFERTEPIFAGKSAACMIKREVYTKAGMFDTYMGILGEESDLAWRVWRLGYKVMFVPKSVTYHKFNTSLKPTADHYTIDRVYRNGCRNYLLMLLKNAPTRLLFSSLPVQLGAWLLASLGHLVLGRASASLAILRGIRDCIHRLPIVLKHRHDNPPQSYASLKPLLRSPPLSYYFRRLRNYLRSGLHG